MACRLLLVSPVTYWRYFNVNGDVSVVVSRDDVLRHVVSGQCVHDASHDAFLRGKKTNARLNGGLLFLWG